MRLTELLVNPTTEALHQVGGVQLWDAVHEIVSPLSLEALQQVATGSMAQLSKTVTTSSQPLTAIRCTSYGSEYNCRQGERELSIDLDAGRLDSSVAVVRSLGGTWKTEHVARWVLFPALLQAGTVRLDVDLTDSKRNGTVTLSNRADQFWDRWSFTVREGQSVFDVTSYLDRASVLAFLQGNQMDCAMSQEVIHLQYCGAESKIRAEEVHLLALGTIVGLGVALVTAICC